LERSSGEPGAHKSPPNESVVRNFYKLSIFIGCIPQQHSQFANHGPTGQSSEQPWARPIEL